MKCEACNETGKRLRCDWPMEHARLGKKSCDRCELIDCPDCDGYGETCEHGQPPSQQCDKCASAFESETRWESLREGDDPGNE
jgi:hypothetical protein